MQPVFSPSLYSVSLHASICRPNLYAIFPHCILSVCMYLPLGTCSSSIQPLGATLVRMRGLRQARVRHMFGFMLTGVLLLLLLLLFLILRGEGVESGHHLGLPALRRPGRRDRRCSRRLRRWRRGRVSLQPTTQGSWPRVWPELDYLAGTGTGTRVPVWLYRNRITVFKNLVPFNRTEIFILKIRFILDF